MSSSRFGASARVGGALALATVLLAAPAGAMLPVPSATGGSAPVAAPAQARSPRPDVTLRGVVRTSTGAPLAGAMVAITGGAETRTADDGTFALTTTPGRHELRVTHTAFVPVARTLDARSQAGPLEITLEPLARFSEEVVVSAVRADAEVPITKRDLDRQEIAALNVGQEMPFLLDQVPSITQYADAGSPTGYSYIYLRGIPQTRLNVTLDGVPLNESEDSAFYFANFGDFADAIGSVQVQRGVGTSTVGAASFAGSVNFASVDFSEAPQADVRLAAGSFGTQRASVSLNSGRIGSGIKLFGLGSYQTTDGFREHSGVTQQSLYAGASRDGEQSYFKVFGFVGRERTHLAYLAADEATLETDLRANPLGPDEHDQFNQRFVTAQYHRALGPAAELAFQGYYNGASGWYLIRDAARGLLQYGLDWRSLGVTASYKVQRDALSFTWGGHVNDFASHHTRELVDGPSDYANRGVKNEVNTFAKLGYTSGRWHHYGDVQLRWARFRYEGDLPIGSVSWSFFNPKAGTRYDLGRGVSVYASIGRALREPARSDLFQGEDNPTIVYDLHAVKPEQVVNVESGLEIARPGLSAQLNAYFMEFRHEIAQTGELSEIGLPLRRNVDRSYRRGFEADVVWQPRHDLRLHQTATFSRNRISSWTQFFDVYDPAGDWIDSTSRTFTNVAPLLTPAVLVTTAADYTPAPWCTLGAVGRYVGRSQLDNTGSPDYTAPGFFGLDASASIGLDRAFGRASRFQPKLRVQVDNVLDNRRMFPSGYSYQYFTDLGGAGLEAAGIRYYYPLATRSVVVLLDLKLAR